MQRLRFFLPLFLVSALAFSNTAPAAPADTVQTKSFLVPAGSQISVRSGETIDSSRAVPGQTYAAQVTNDVRNAKGAVLIPHGAHARLVVKSVSSGGKIKGAAEVVLALHSVSIAGKTYTVNTSNVREEGTKGIGANKRTGKYVGGGAAGGGVLGAIVGGGKGAIIGGVLGAGAGGTAQVLTKDKAIQIPAESLMTFRLQAPVRVAG
jgi:hypothetical protein